MEIKIPSGAGTTHHVTLLKTQDGDVPTTINVLVNSFHCHSTLIAVQVHYDTIQNDLIINEHIHLIYCLQSSLRLFKSGYPASNIVINSSPSSPALILYITLFYLQLLMSYGQPTAISDSSTGIIRYTKNW